MPSIKNNYCFNPSKIDCLCKHRQAIQDKKSSERVVVYHDVMYQFKFADCHTTERPLSLSHSSYRIYKEFLPTVIFNLCNGIKSCMVKNSLLCNISILMWDRTTWKFNLRIYHLNFERNPWKFVTYSLYFQFRTDKIPHIVRQVMHYYLAQVCSSTKSLTAL